MIKKTLFADEIMQNMNNVLSDDKEVIDLTETIDMLHSAMDLLDNNGFIKEADGVMNIVNKMAYRTKKPSTDKATKGLTPDKMVANLINHGTEFNLVDDGQGLDDLLEADIEERNIDVDEMKEMNFEDEL
jgi:hypothetical protein